MPQYYNGKPYGYTCITKISPQYDRKQVEYVRLTVIKQSSKSANSTRKELLLTDGDKKAWVAVYTDSATAPDYYDMRQAAWNEA
jgi:hypothetical protein